MTKRQRAQKNLDDKLSLEGRIAPAGEAIPGERLELSCYLPFRVGILSQRLLREASLIYKKARLPLTTPQWMVFCVLANYQPLVASEISRISLIDEVGVSRAVASLKRLGLVIRTKSRQDQRVLEISLTESGWVFYLELAARMEEQQALIQAAVTQEEFRMFLGLIDRLDGVMNSMADLRHIYGEAADVSEIYAGLPGSRAGRPDISRAIMAQAIPFGVNLHTKRR